jgi:hypothetical protein
MSEETKSGQEQAPEIREGRRAFLGHLGRWSGASLAAVVGGAAWLGGSNPVHAASWINRRHGGAWTNRGGAWANRGGGAAWANRGGAWANRGAAWANRGGGGAWANRGGGGGWVNRRGGAGWINRR